MAEPEKPPQPAPAAATPGIKPGSPWPKPAPPPPKIEPAAKPDKVDEVGGPAGPEPTRFGDWEVKGRVSDF